MEKEKAMIKEWIEQTTSNIWSFLSGVIGSILAFFLPIKDIVNVMVFFFILDVIFGYWAARKLRGERFSAALIWNTTMPRMVLSIIVIMGTYIWENVYYGIGGNTYKMIGGFISGVLLVSIIQNGYKITEWSVFNQLIEIVKNKLPIKNKEDEEDKINE